MDWRGWRTARVERFSVWLRSALSRELVRAGISSYGLAGLTLVANLAAGIASARALAPAGRGEAVAIAMVAQNLGLLFAFGCANAVTFERARNPAVASRLALTWVLFLIPIAAVAVVVGQLVLPILFSAQSAEALQLGRVYVFTVTLVLWAELNTGLILGRGDYVVMNLVRFAQPALAAASQVLLWQLGELTVETSLATAAGSTILVQATASRWALRRIDGLGPIDVGLGLKTFWYGLRGHGAVLGGALNQRLDLVIMPAFLAAAGVGLYSIAANVSLIVSTLANSLAIVVLPAAVRGGERGPARVVASLQVALLIAVALAGTIFVVADPALTLIYGSEFGDAAASLRILLPGTVLLAGASILGAGLYAANRPGTVTVTQLGGLVATIVGLLVVLPDGGIEGAAVVSTVSYAIVFAVSLVAYRRAVALRWRAFLARPRL